MCQGAVPALFPVPDLPARPVLRRHQRPAGDDDRLLVGAAAAVRPGRRPHARTASSCRSDSCSRARASRSAALTADYGVELVAVAVGGIGVGLFHPDAARRARVAAGSQVATGFSFFSVGGNAGFALAPTLITPAVLLFGLAGALVVLVPCAGLPPALLAAPPAAAAHARDAAGAATPPERRSLGRRSRRIGAHRRAALGRVLRPAGVPGRLLRADARHLRRRRQRGPHRDARRRRARARSSAAALADRVDPRLVLLGSMALQPLLLALLLTVRQRRARRRRRGGARVRHRRHVQRDRRDGPGLPAVAAGPRLRRHARPRDRRRRPDRRAARAGRGRRRHRAP